MNDTSQVRQLTLRALATGMLIGGLLAPCNIYAGLKIGWTFNMSITAVLLSYGFWDISRRVVGTPHWGPLENNINQTAASSAASIAGAGLVAPIPALTMLTGQSLPWHWLVVWVLAVSFVGVAVAIGLRRQMLIIERLPFPAGIATAHTMREVYARGREALARVRMLIGGLIGSATLKLFDVFVQTIPKVPLLGKLSLGKATAHNLGFLLDSSLLMVGFGAIIGMRASASLLLGALVAWGGVAPFALAMGWIHGGQPGPDAIWFGPVLEWLLWPGIAMMVMASLTSFAFSWRSAARALIGRVGAPAGSVEGDVSPRTFVAAVAAAFVIATIAQHAFFGINWLTAGFAVGLTFVLAIVAGRVSGETGITPIGAMGKVTQLTFGFVSPGSATTNLMAANVTGGAASQCADMLHDLKAGLLLGAAPRLQAVAQLCGVLAGAVAGTAAYLVLVPSPADDLLTAEWPAPAVATWKAVAEVFQRGAGAMPKASVGALWIGGAVGIALASMERLLPERVARFVPSPASVGLAFVIPFWNSLSMFIGASAALLATRYAKGWAERFVIVLAAGLVAGESLAGVAGALLGLLTD